MPIHTIEQLDNELSNDLAWRRKELSIIKNLIESQSGNLSQKNALIRGGMTLLYAHWEGFVKSSSGAYLEFVSLQRLKYEELAINFIAYAMKSQLNIVSMSNKPSSHNSVAKFFVSDMSKRSSIPYKAGVNTKSNLSSDVLRDIVDMLGLDYAKFEAKEKLIDETLLKNRNSIAHGNYLNISRESYLELHNQVIAMMEIYRNNIDNNVTLKLYRADTSL